MKLSHQGQFGGRFNGQLSTPCDKTTCKIPSGRYRSRTYGDSGLFEIDCKAFS